MSRFDNVTDRELMILLQEAIEMQDGKNIKYIKEEITRRNRDE